MDKKQSRLLIQQLFTQAFDRERYQNFLRNLLNRIEPGSRGGRQYTGNLIPEAFNGHVNQYWCLGKYVDPEGNELDLLVVEVKTFTKLERARSALRNFAVNRLKQFEKEASLIAFYAQDDKGADWRFSFVKIEHGAYKDEKGKVKIKQELTPARRHSFLVGVHENSHTACRQLLPLLEMDYADAKIEEIEAAFSIEKVTGEFFDQYKALFVKLADHLKKQPFFRQTTVEETDQAVSRFAKKLLGQIVFLYFLQKKGWLGVTKDKAWGDGSRRFMQEQYDQVAGMRGGYFRDFLQYLFYEALADDRRGQADPGYYQRFNCRVPFLNGGLFEADYDWRKVAIDIPNNLFRNNEKNKAGDEGTGILDVFGRYNFTIKEDEPLDKEVAVDPEMLGKVFENMLEITERKSKGAFYTPREIVHYMCQESLVNYLHTELNRTQSGPGAARNSLFAVAGDENQVSREDLETLVRKGHLFVENDEAALLALQRIEEGKQKTTGKKVELPEAVKNKAALLDEKLAAIKVCDPAIGSGAFPVGLLHEIVTARLALAPHSGNRQTPYQLKRHAIAHSIYGVDIDPSAIDIARLRLWLSLIVDEDNYDDIAALPNLDYKIMQGNSLVEEYWGVKLFNEEFIREDDRNEAKIERLREQQSEIQKEFLGLHNANKLTAEKKRFLEKEAKNIEKKIKALRNANGKDPRQGLFDVVSEAKRKAGQLEQLHQDFFAASSPKKKQEIRGRISELEWELIEATLTERNQQDLLEKLEDIRKSGEKPFFLWKLNFSEVFKEKGGFDVVIGNPPYVQIQNFSGRQIQQDLEAQHYETFAKTGDIYCLFYERGHRLLRENGALCFITSNKWMRAGYGKKMREFLLNQATIRQLIDFGDSPIFSEATTYTNVLLFEKEKRQTEAFAWDLSSAFRKATSLNRMLEENPAGTALFSEDGFVIASAQMAAIKKWIEEVATPLKDWDVAIYRGILTGYNEAFIIDGRKKDELIAADPKSAEIIKPILRGRDIKSYRVDFADLWLVATFPALNLNINEYPALRDYLESFGRKLHQTGEKVGQDSQGKIIKSRKKTGNKWFETQDQIAYYPDFKKEKIVWLEMSPKPNFAFSGNEVFVLNTSYILTGKHLKWLLAILNSEVMDCYFPMVATDVRGKTRRYIKQYVELLPVVPRRESYAGFLEPLVDYAELAKSKEMKLQSAYFEQLIDGLVYELYFLDEIKAAGKEILPHLGELPPITDTQSTEEKLAVIQAQFDRLYDPRNPVRNHLETLDSVEVVKTIREALKR
jgi:methylase of polypeptide subunit release factors